MDKNPQANNNNGQENFTDILMIEGVNAKGYGMIPKMVMQDTRLTPEAKCIYSYFCSYAGAGSQAFPSVKLIIYHLGMSETRYYKHFKLLKDYGYIKTTQSKSNGKFSKTIYTIVSNPKPSISFECTGNESTENESAQNEGYNINSIKSNSININKYIYPSTEMQNSDDRQLHKIETEPKSKDLGNTMQKIKGPKKKKTLYQCKSSRNLDLKNISHERYLNVLENCSIGHLDESYRDAVSKIIKTFFWDIENKERIEIGENSIPAKIFSEEIEKLNYFMIDHAVKKFEQASRDKKIINPLAYLKSCIYNSISQMNLEVQSDCMRLGLV
ncbi:MAG: hypothetical protein CVV02_01510 [Firmicutes bacterium HGW-Firmicutes-7]|nr:MAG: hypothetical protein CVV02_01510 [Firmicutes bacterium HGW-Firmicutes-7]